MNKLYIFIIFNVLVFSSVVGQEIHFTQYEKAPTLVNPAFVGQFSGTFRVNGIYRDQYRTAADKAFQSFAITADLPVITGFRKQDWLGAGIMLANDKSGTAAQQMSHFGLNVGYHLGLDKKQTRILSIGAQFTSGALSYNLNDITNNSFSSGLLGGISSLASDFMNPMSGGGENNDIDGGSLSDLQVGLLYNVRGKTTDFKIGASVDGILSPDRAFSTSQTDKKSIGINAIGIYEHEVSKKTSLMHSLYFSTQDGASFINVNSRLKYKLKQDSEYKLIGGLGTRSGRAVLFYTGLEKGPWQVGLSYDFDLGGSIDATNNHKSIELGVTYLGIINKRPEPKPIIYCPRI